MKNTIKIRIAKRCMLAPNESSMVFVTRCTRSRVFKIPHAHILNRATAEIKINDVATEPAIELSLTPWIYSKIKEDLDRMRSRNLIILKNNYD